MRIRPVTAPTLALLVLALALALTLGVADATHAAPAAPPALSPANMDTTCAPCRDFNRFANGRWIDQTAIPAAYSSWGSFDELAERNQEILHGIVERAAADKQAAPESDTGRLGAYWCACMDSARADALGATPIAARLAAIAAIGDTRGLAPAVAALHENGIPGLFGFRSMQDPKKSTQVIAATQQGGLGLPDRDYYLRTDSAAVATRQEYAAFIARTFALLGDDNAPARAQAERIIALETALARASMTNVQRRDPQAVYHKMSVDSLARLAPRFDWAAYLAARRLGGLDSINVNQPAFARAVDSLVTAVPLVEWKAYLRWKVALAASPDLSRPFVDQAFAFERMLTGAESMLPRWKRCLRAIDADLGDVLGRAYVEERFPPVAKASALRMVKNLEAALGDRIEGLEWMGPETRRQALDKLNAFADKIGYPDTWRDYAGITLAKDTHYANRVSAQAWEARHNLDKIGKPVNRGEWSMTTPAVNAYYSGQLNSINFPAGILQPPFFDPAWDDAMNYGAIGMVIGHEMSHGFDDRGRQFDAQGNMRDWWTPDDAARYKERAQKVVEQFDGYTVLDSLHLNGRLTLGENIADLSGLAIAHHALEKALAGTSGGRIDGFTPEQRFFLSYSQVWREAVRPASMRTQVQTDPHSPGMWRINGPLSNLQEFARAFGCKEGDAMVRPAEKRAQLW